MDIVSEMNARAAKIESVIKKYLPAAEGYQRVVIEAMNYSVLAGGKRLRPMLMEAAFELFGGEGTVVEPFMAAIEMIHTYSLIHDDLPAMDNDEYRRGKLTCHAKYGEALGILAGDGLLNYAFETALTAFELDADGARIKKALGILAKKAGIYGMIGGQTADVWHEKNADDVMGMEKLDFIYRLKTGALIEASLMIGALLAGADDAMAGQMEEAGAKLGMAFQIQDDILDLTSTQEVLGKPIGSDDRNNKTTYVTCVGLEQAAVEVERLTMEAVGILDSFSSKAMFLRELFLYLIHREK